MSIHYGGRYTDISKITGPSGWYNILIDGSNVPVYIDQSYDGGGWVCVLANRAYTAGMNNLSYYNAINTPNYRTGGANNGTNTNVTVPTKLGTLANYNIWIGLKYWKLLSGRLTTNKMTIVQFVSSSNGTALSSTGSHNKRYRWRSSFFNGTYGFNSVEALSDETSTGVPGMYSYHAANNFNLSTYDLANGNTCGCSGSYNNNPFWYGCCWSGNYFAGGGYQDAPYWDSSGSDYWQYGAVYIK